MEMGSFYGSHAERQSVYMNHQRSMKKGLYFTEKLFSENNSPKDFSRKNIMEKL